MPRLRDDEKQAKLGALRKMGNFWNPFAPSPEQKPKEPEDAVPVAGCKPGESEEDCKARKQKEHDRKELEGILKF